LTPLRADIRAALDCDPPMRAASRPVGFHRENVIPPPGSSQARGLSERLRRYLSGDYAFFHQQTRCANARMNFKVAGLNCET